MLEALKALTLEDLLKQPYLLGGIIALAGVVFFSTILFFKSVFASPELEEEEEAPQLTARLARMKGDGVTSTPRKKR